MTDTPPANKPPNPTDPSPTYFDLESPLLPRKNGSQTPTTTTVTGGGTGSCRISFFRGGSSGEGQWRVDEITI